MINIRIAVHNKCFVICQITGSIKWSFPYTFVPFSILVISIRVFYLCYIVDTYNNKCVWAIDFFFARRWVWVCVFVFAHTQFICIGFLRSPVQLLFCIVSFLLFFWCVRCILLLVHLFWFEFSSLFSILNGIAINQSTWMLMSVCVCTPVRFNERNDKIANFHTNWFAININVSKRNTENV